MKITVACPECQKDIELIALFKKELSDLMRGVAESRDEN